MPTNKSTIPSSGKKDIASNGQSKEVPAGTLCVEHCKHKNKPGSEDMVRCIQCMLWYHPGCCDSPEDVEHQTLMWCCLRCRELPAQVRALGDEIACLKQSNQELTKLVSDVLSKLSVMSIVSAGSREGSQDVENHGDEVTNRNSDVTVGPGSDGDDKGSGSDSGSERGSTADSDAEAGDLENSDSSSTSGESAGAETAWGIPVEWQIPAKERRKQRRRRRRHVIRRERLLASRAATDSVQQAESSTSEDSLSEDSVAQVPAVQILGDSIPKHVDKQRMSRILNTDVIVSNNGGTINSTTQHIQKEVSKDDVLIVHTGTRLLSREPLLTTQLRLRKLEDTIKRKGLTKVALSGVIYRRECHQMYGDDAMRRKTLALNELLLSMSSRNNWEYIDNDRVGESCLSWDGLHLNKDCVHRLGASMLSCAQRLLRTSNLC